MLLDDRAAAAGCSPQAFLERLLMESNKDTNDGKLKIEKCFCGLPISQVNSKKDDGKIYVKCGRNFNDLDGENWSIIDPPAKKLKKEEEKEKEDDIDIDKILAEMPGEYSYTQDPLHDMPEYHREFHISNVIDERIDVVRLNESKNKPGYWQYRMDYFGMPRCYVIAPTMSARVRSMSPTPPGSKLAASPISPSPPQQDDSSPKSLQELKMLQQSTAISGVIQTFWSLTNKWREDMSVLQSDEVFGLPDFSDLHKFIVNVLDGFNKLVGISTKADADYRKFVKNLDKLPIKLTPSDDSSSKPLPPSSNPEPPPEKRKRKKEKSKEKSRKRRHVEVLEEGTASAALPPGVTVGFHTFEGPGPGIQQGTFGARLRSEEEETELERILNEIGLPNSSS
ncbi:hypothetical protein AC249_AIPGENE21531 [Exaiptasia diaphana]|nr:hypothetical protein AC249_AIPGENE21531 [Exaiptasia diaphana]